MIVANKHHLQGLDELHRKVQLEAMALALGRCADCRAELFDA